MKREWEMVEGEKKGRSSREAKRSVCFVRWLLSIKIGGFFRPKFEDDLHLVCRKRPQATVRPSWREKSNDKEEKEEDGPEQKRYFPLHNFLCSLSMLSSLAEVIEVAIRAEYQVRSADTQPSPQGLRPCECFSNVA